MSEEEIKKSLRSAEALVEDIIVDYKRLYNKLKILRARLKRISEEFEITYGEEELEEEEEEKYFEI